MAVTNENLQEGTKAKVHKHLTKIQILLDFGQLCRAWIWDSALISIGFEVPRVSISKKLLTFNEFATFENP